MKGNTRNIFIFKLFLHYYYYYYYYYYYLLLLLLLLLLSVIILFIYLFFLPYKISLSVAPWNSLNHHHHHCNHHEAIRSWWRLAWYWWVKQSSANQVQENLRWHSYQLIKCKGVWGGILISQSQHREEGQSPWTCLTILLIWDQNIFTYIEPFSLIFFFVI